MKISKLGWLGALVAVAAVIGAVASTPKSADALNVASATKTCLVTATPNVFTCSFVVTTAAGFTIGNAAAVGPSDTYTVTMAGPAVFSAPVSGVTSLGNAACTVSISGQGPTGYTVTVNNVVAAGCLMPGTITLTEEVTVTGPVAPQAGGLPVSQVVVNPFSGTNANAVAVGLLFTAAAAGPFPVTISSAGCTTGVVFVAPGNTGLTVNPGTSVTCRVDLDDTEPTPPGPVNASEFVGTGIVSITIQNAPGIPFAQLANVIGSPGSGAASVVGATSTIRCGVAVPPGPVEPIGSPVGGPRNSCDFVDVTFTVEQTTILVGLPATLGVNVSYAPDAAIQPPQNSAQSAAFNLFTITQGVAGFIQPSLRLTCTNAFTLGGIVSPTFLQTVRPSQIGGTSTLVGVGILPGSVNCTIETGVIVAGVFTPRATAPGTIEVSSLSGTLATLSGTLSTNLRIACGDPAVFTPGVTIDPNTCQGVRFSVIGQGVGFVEVRGRYEPTSAAQAAGITEVEVGGNVEFVAPAVSISLALDPDPVAVGANGTATASLRTIDTFGCGSTIGGSLVLCIDPLTGTNIQVSSTAGSVLNGVVVFTIQDTAIARFTETGIANAGTTLNLGVTSTANQVTRNCGAFSGGGLTAGNLFFGQVTALAPFFGGCTTAAATYTGVNPGSTNIAASFIAFLPGAQSAISSITGFSSSFTLGAGLQQVNFFAPGIGNATTARVLQVAGAAPATTMTTNLVRGCNNVTPTTTETVSAFAGRVNPTNVVISVWEYNTATSSFRGAPGPATTAAGAAAAADLEGVTRLRPVFICVNASAVLTQPAI